MSTLFVVATPIGNLEDMTFRAVRILREVDWIACEDTRETRKLLDHYGIEKHTISYHDHNEMERSKELVARLAAGESGAIVSDAGMPLISDPGYRLVRAAIEAGIRVEPLPGASASLTALAASGLPTDAFHFVGFLPSKSGQRDHALEALRNERSTLICYEAPHRILETLEAIERLMGPRPVVLARELTKVHEEFVRGTASEIRAELAKRGELRGEMTLLIGKATKPMPSNVPIEQAYRQQLHSGLSRMDAMKALARERGISKREIYKKISREEHTHAQPVKRT